MGRWCALCGQDAEDGCGCDGARPPARRVDYDPFAGAIAAADPFAPGYGTVSKLLGKKRLVEAARDMRAIAAAEALEGFAREVREGRIVQLTLRWLGDELNASYAVR